MRIVFRLPAKGLLIVGVFGDAEIMHAYANILRSHRIEKAIAADAAMLLVNKDGIEMEGMAGIRFCLRWQGDGQIGKGLNVALPDFLPSVPVFLHPLQLVDTNGRL